MYYFSDSDGKMKYSKEFCIKCIISESNYTIGSCLYGVSQTGIDIILHTKSNPKALSLTIMPQSKVEKMIDVIVQTPTIVSKPEIRKYSKFQSESPTPNLMQSITIFMKRYWYIILPIFVAYIVAGVIKATNDEQESS
ncbi:hypothetical protein MXB_5166 [Myxobolus squamalis]|nr:hypothetical protein MXB_5166 [Myxobolus squamalis]